LDSSEKNNLISRYGQVELELFFCATGGLQLGFGNKGYLVIIKYVKLEKDTFYGVIEKFSSRLYSCRRANLAIQRICAFQKRRRLARLALPAYPVYPSLQSNISEAEKHKPKSSAGHV
jgi:hypothetical protein